MEDLKNAIEEFFDAFNDMFNHFDSFIKSVKLLTIKKWPVYPKTRYIKSKIKMAYNVNYLSNRKMPYQRRRIRNYGSKRSS